MTKKAIIDKDTTKEPFRLFGNTKPVWFDVEEDYDVSFFIRPMSTPERAVYNASENALQASLDYVGAYKRAGLSADEVIGDVPKGLEGDALVAWSVTQNENWSKVTAKLTTDLDVQRQFAEVSRDTAVACVELVKINGAEREFTLDMYESIEDNDIRVWLIECIKKASTINEGERVGL